MLKPLSMTSPRSPSAAARVSVRVPIRVRQWPRFAWQAVEQALTLRRRPAAAQPVTFKLCYFSCHSYFKYLYCALHSLTLAAPTLRYEVIVFSDNDQPLSAAQIDELRQLMPTIRVIDWPKSMGWGATQIGWIWKAYGLVAEDAQDHDVIVRVDSDVFFFNDRIFRAVERSSADFVGDGHFVDFQYLQGGCYFFRVNAVRRVNQYLAGLSLPEELSRAAITVEDIAAFHFARQLGLRVWMVWFMMFPDELRNAGGLSRWQRWKFSCLHFVMKNKSAMIDAYELEVLDDKHRDGFRKAMQVI
jgi:Glycosyl transferase family 2